MRVRVLSLLVLAGVVAAPALAQYDRRPGERGMGGVGILVFQDANYRGRNATFRDEVPQLGEFGLDNRISSLRVAPGETWEVCEQPWFRGRCQVFYGDEPNLQLRGWNDRISSMRPVRGGGGGGWRPPVDPPGPPSWGGRGVELFEDRGFRGDRREITGAVEDLRSLGFNDKARSLRLPRGESWEVCIDNYFRNCRVVNTDWPDLDGLNMSRRISSLRPWRQGGFPPGPGPGAGRAQLTLYDNRDFRGRSMTVTEPREFIGGFSAESATAEGPWQVCDQPRFNGNCAVIRSSEPDLRRLGLRGRVQSARPAAVSRPY